MDTVERHELTTEQMREIVRLRRRHPKAEVVVHPKPWGIVVEARRSGRAIELRALRLVGRGDPGPAHRLRRVGDAAPALTHGDRSTRTACRPRRVSVAP